ncbi:MAG: hypothetical protein ACFFBH_17480, partial [Promethearchaeota archaeon]
NRKSPIFYLKFEKRVYGKATKPRDKLIVYQVESEKLKGDYFSLITEYDKINKDLENINKEIKKYNNEIEKSDTKKDIKKIESKVAKLLKDVNIATEEKEKIKGKLDQLLQTNTEGLIEVKKLPNRLEFEDQITEVNLSKKKPSELSTEQFNSLFHAFKSVKYMAPPTDTAIPVGEQVLENTLIKEIGLQVSENIDDFELPVDDINQISADVLQSKKKALVKENPSIGEEILNNIKISKEELVDLNSQILANIIVQNDGNVNQLKETISLKDDGTTNYQDVFEFFIENYTKEDDFVSAETRSPTSGKGLAYVVEAALAYCNDPAKLETPKRSRDVLSRFVNRTPKLRDSADCAITKAVQSVNWKNYKLDTFDNNLPKGPIKLLINVSGPYVHLMFKSQSKNALADDEDLIKEIKYCLEAIGRRLRVYLNRKHAIHKKEKRASLIEKYIPQFVESLYNISSNGNSKYKSQMNKDELIDLMKNAIGVKPTISKPSKDTMLPEKAETLIEQERKVIKEEPPQVEIPKEIEIEKIKEIKNETKTQVAVKTREIVKKPSKDKKLELPIITTEKILNAMSKEDWQPITYLILKLKIKDMMDARFLQLKMKELVRKELVEERIIKTKKHWKLR